MSAVGDGAISTRAAYLAMVEFLHACLERGPTELVLLVHAVTLDTDGTPNDPAMWDDWLDAVTAVRSQARITGEGDAGQS